ncbi:MAG: arylesterase, partial [Vicinamibacteria bacterium]
AIGLSSIACLGCQGSESDQRSGQTPGQTEDPRQEVAVAAEPERPKIVALGDSLTAGLGLALDEAYPAVLQERLDERSYQFEVVNAGVSGDTTAGGLRRLDWVLEGDVRILILALGGNDGLRGLPVAEMKRNLATMIERAQSRGIAVLLTSMEAPPNLGASYTAEFRQVFRELEKEYDVASLPFLLQDVAGERALNQPDGIHPNSKGARVLANNVWTILEPMLATVSNP